MRSQKRPYNPLAEMVRQARLSKGMTQRQLSRALGMSEGYVGHLESGRFRPNIQTLKSLSKEKMPEKMPAEDLKRVTDRCRSAFYIDVLVGIVGES